jgi:tetratricopeptide (TPR) repeat protein
MQEGFIYLETGKYAKAETFFKNALKEYPHNKTARLCYGRAIGLNGKSQQAITLFKNLLTDYPNDFEVKLNYGESLLWNSNFPKAKTYFKGLIDEDAKSFPALLSYANTLSNLKEYEDALIYVNKALVVLPGNPNALTSKKYMYLGYAYQKQQAQNYSGAEALLKENLTLFNNDKDTLLNLANLYLISNQYEKAEDTYNRISENPVNTTTALNGLALVSHLNGKEKEALKISKQAFDGLTNTNKLFTQQTTERYIQALIWNKKYKAAETLINGLVATKPNENWVLALRATLNTYKGDFKKSLKDYNNILVNDSISFDGNLGKANAQKASGLYNDAYASANKTLTIFENQKDAVNFIKILDKQFTPFVETKIAYSFDNGNNEATTFSTNVTLPLSTKLKVNGLYSYRDSKNTEMNN